MRDVVSLVTDPTYVAHDAPGPGSAHVDPYAYVDCSGPGVEELISELEGRQGPAEPLAEFNTAMVAFIRKAAEISDESEMAKGFSWVDTWPLPDGYGGRD